MSFRDLYIRFLIWLGAEPPPGYAEPLSKAQRIKYSFQIAAFITAIVLFILFIAIFIFSCCTSILGEDLGKVNVFTLLVEIAIGVFTVWGLYWAASEFAEAQLKPDLNLIVGAGATPLREPSAPFQGYHNNVGGKQEVPIGLWLENKQSKAAQFVRITLRHENVAEPCYFTTSEDWFPYYKPKINTVHENQQFAIFLQFDGNLVVYKGDGVYLGNIQIAWSKDTQPPVSLSLRVGLYNLTGEPKTISVSHPISWD